MAAEIDRQPARDQEITHGFNEAAANGRGNARRGRRPCAARSCFNEAAANGRGNRGRPARGAAASCWLQ